MTILGKTIQVGLITLTALSVHADSEPEDAYQWSAPEYAEIVAAPALEEDASVCAEVIENTQQEAAPFQGVQLTEISFSLPKDNDLDIADDIFDDLGLEMKTIAADTPDEVALGMMDTPSKASTVVMAESIKAEESYALVSQPHPSRYEPLNKTKPPVDLPRFYEGTLKMRRGLFSNRNYSMFLQGPSGNRIGYIDISELLLTGKLDRYLDKRVIVQGVPSPASKPSNVVIKAKAMRMKGA